MGGCKIAETLCKDEYHKDVGYDLELSMNDKNMTESFDMQAAISSAANDFSNSCPTEIGRFVLIYFPPGISSRDICAKTDQRAAETVSPCPGTPLVTAVKNYDSLFGNDPFREFHLYESVYLIGL
jgi:hypothetical protein